MTPTQSCLWRACEKDLAQVMDQADAGAARVAAPVPRQAIHADGLVGKRPQVSGCEQPEPGRFPQSLREGTESMSHDAARTWRMTGALHQADPATAASELPAPSLP
jgi:hypothetical protein